MERGWTKTPNNLLESILGRKGLSKNKLKVLLLLARLQYGCHRERAKIIKADLIAIGIDGPTATPLIKEMVEKNLIFCDDSRKEMWINVDEILGLETLKEDRLTDLLSKNLRKRKPRSLRTMREDLVKGKSMDSSF